MASSLEASVKAYAAARNALFACDEHRGGRIERLLLRGLAVPHALPPGACACFDGAVHALKTRTMELLRDARIVRAPRHAFDWIVARAASFEVRGDEWLVSTTAAVRVFDGPTMQLTMFLSPPRAFDWIECIELRGALRERFRELVARIRAGTCAADERAVFSGDHDADEWCGDDDNAGAAQSIFEQPTIASQSLAQIARSEGVCDAEAAPLTDFERDCVRAILAPFNS